MDGSCNSYDWGNGQQALIGSGMFAGMRVWLGFIALACSACVRVEPGPEPNPVEPTVHGAPADDAPKISSDEIAHGSSETGEAAREQVEQGSGPRHLLRHLAAAVAAVRRQVWGLCDALKLRARQSASTTRIRRCAATTSGVYEWAGAGLA